LFRNRIIVAFASSFELHISRKRRKESSRRFTLESSERRSSKQDTAVRRGGRVSGGFCGADGLIGRTCNCDDTERSQQHARISHKKSNARNMIAWILSKYGTHAGRYSPPIHQPTPKLHTKITSKHTHRRPRPAHIIQNPILAHIVADRCPM
jgi:hypothetical protein